MNDDGGGLDAISLTSTPKKKREIQSPGMISLRLDCLESQNGVTVIGRGGILYVVWVVLRFFFFPRKHSRDILLLALF